MIKSLVVLAGSFAALATVPLAALAQAGGAVVKDVTPPEAARIVETSPKAKILDVRSQAEFIFVGHPVGAVNIPLQFWDSSTYEWSANPDFDAKVLAAFPKQTPIITICRSGQRSKTAAMRLVALGYTEVYNMVESFEGSVDPKTGMRTVNGWKNRGLPSTYRAVEGELYRP